MISQVIIHQIILLTTSQLSHLEKTQEKRKIKENLRDQSMLTTLVPEVFLNFSSFHETTNTRCEVARKKNLCLPQT